MKQIMTFIMFLVATTPSLFAGDQAVEGANAWASWIGNFHFIFVHFPIALIIMACVAELIFSLKKDPRYGFVVNFLLISAALLVIPTVITGLSLEESGGGLGENPLVEWHETFGIITLALTFITLVLRNFQASRLFYLLSMVLLLISVCVTAHLGGRLAFGALNYFPPVW